MLVGRTQLFQPLTAAAAASRRLERGRRPLRRRARFQRCATEVARWWLTLRLRSHLPSAAPRPPRYSRRCSVRQRRDRFRQHATLAAAATEVGATATEVARWWLTLRLRSHLPPPPVDQFSRARPGLFWRAAAGERPPLDHPVATSCVTITTRPPAPRANRQTGSGGSSAPWSRTLRD